MGHLHGVSRPPRQLNAAATSLYLSTLFVLVYGSMNWLAARRADVGSWYFSWEHRVPFVSWLIVPYMAIDLFFIAAPFLCTDAQELRAFRRRMTAAIVLAGACFGLMPLRFAFPRPVPEDWTAPIFQLLHGADQPYNLFPSLHIAITMILAGTYGRQCRGSLQKAAVYVWFSVIALSTLLTHQHHVIDLAGGFVLALGCYYLVPEHGGAVPLAVNANVGRRYAVCAALCAAAGIWLRPAGLLLMWPAIALAIVAGAYFGLYAGITGKERGRLPLSAVLILAPWLIGQHLSLFYYKRRCSPWDRIAPNVWIGRRLSEREAAAAVKAGVTAVLDLTAEFSEPRSFLRLTYLNVPVLDLTAPSAEQVEAAVEFITMQRRTGIVYVHCKIGYSRTAAVVGAWLRDAGLADSAEAAVAHMTTIRPSMVVRPEAWQVLRA